MKRKLTVMVLGPAIVLASVIYACKKTSDTPDKLAKPGQETLSLNARNGNLTASQGWLQFKDLAAFNLAMDDLHRTCLTAAELNKWEDAHKQGNFQSLRRSYELIDADTAEARTAPTVDSLINNNQLLNCPDSWFATVLSKDGMIQVADTIYSFKPGQKNGEAYSVPARYAAELLKGVAPSTIADAKMHTTSFFVFPVPRWKEVGDITIGGARLPICLYPNGQMTNWWGQVGGDIYGGDDGIAFPDHNGRQVKLQYQRWRVGYIFYASTGVRVKMLKHTRFAGWQSVTYANEMIMEACCKGTVITPGFPSYQFSAQTSPDWPGFVHYAENNFEKTLKWTASGFWNDIILDHFNFHFRVNYRDRIVERMIRQ